jgi:polyphosphate kinase 2 (PPK2 family)
MSKATPRKSIRTPTPPRPLDENDYQRKLHRLQIELVKLHRHVIAGNRKVLIILEGRDAAGKDGTVKRIAEHLSPREVRVVASGMPMRTNPDAAPWIVVRADDKHRARLNIIRDILTRIRYSGRRRHNLQPDMGVARDNSDDLLVSERLAP